MRLVIINKRPWAIGLAWSTRSMSNKFGKKETATNFRKRLADNPKNKDFTVVTLRPGQYGLGTSGEDTVWQKARSLAASLKITSTSFLGLFQLLDVNGERFWWVYALRSGLISAQSDKIFESREAAEEHIRVSIKELLGDFEKEVVCESVEKSIAWLSPFLRSWLPRQGSLVSIRAQHAKKQRKQKKKLLIIILILGLIITGIGVNQFLKHKAGQRALEAARLILRDKEAYRKELMDHPEKFFPTPWMTEPDPTELWSICNPALLSLPIVASGWVLASATCNETDVIVNWTHQPGASYLVLPPKAKLGKSPQEAISRFNISAKLKPGTGVPYKDLLKRDEISRYFYQLTQETATHLKLSFQEKETKTLNKITIKAPWLVGAWELTNIPTTLLFDSSLANALKQPGILLKSIRYNTNVWTLKGETYVIE